MYLYLCSQLSLTLNEGRDFIRMTPPLLYRYYALNLAALTPSGISANSLSRMTMISANSLSRS